MRRKQTIEDKSLVHLDVESSTEAEWKQKTMRIKVSNTITECSRCNCAQPFIGYINCCKMKIIVCTHDKVGGRIVPLETGDVIFNEKVRGIGIPEFCPLPDAYPAQTE